MGDSALHFVPGEHPTPRDDALVDILFVHGLTGDHEQSWQHPSGGFWPRWLAEDLPQANVYCASYPSSVWSDFGKGGGANLLDLGGMLLDLVVSKCGTKRPVIFITHSLGGLVVKQLIRKSAGASNLRKRLVSERVRGIAFIATPHQGAEIVKLIQGVVSALTSNAVKSVPSGAPPLLDLGEWFSTWAAEADIEIASYYELKKYKGTIVVDQMSANPNILGCDPTAIDEDHVTICKILSRDCQLYGSVRSMIDGILENTPAAMIAERLSFGDDLLSEYEALTKQAAADRRTLAQKLADAGREYDIERAEAMKERFSMSLHRHSALPSAVDHYTRIMSAVESRFNLHVAPAISQGVSSTAVNQLIQKEVVDPVISSTSTMSETITPGQVESVIFYLAGNCHIGWDDA